MRKSLSNRTFLVVGLGLIATTFLGITGALDKWGQTPQQSNRNVNVIESSSPQQNRYSPVLALASMPSQQRELQLKQLASAESSLDRSRASFLLASDLIKQNRTEEALKQLQGLDKDFPLLAPYILLKQGRVYTSAEETVKAKETWHKLLNKYPDSPAVVEALYLLGKKNPAYWQQAIEQFPYHPLTHQIAHKLLEQNPNQPNLIRLLVKYTPDDKTVDPLRERLVQEYASQLTPADWQGIADNYWQQWQYEKAGKAYTRAPHTPRNLYRAARGTHLGGNQKEAQKYYQQLIQSFPNAEETGLGLRRLASISSKQQALSYLDLVISQFPQEAAQALIEKAEILESLNSPALAAQARQLVLTRYANSEAAAEYRWNIAQKKAQAGDLITAWQWAQPIAVNNPDSPLAPKASFWIGKWASQLDRPQEAQTAFESVLVRYPQSYYAWRSAVALGWNVGDFTTVRQMLPPISRTSTRSLLPVGSPIVRELYQLGLDKEAWTQFQAEIGARDTLSIAEQFIYGLMKLDRGEYLRGINQIWQLKEQSDPQAQQEWKSLRQMPEYWQALFPFPFEETIFKWSQQRELNPLLVTALIRQESRFESEISSVAGAVGLMQVMPGTGQWVAERIQLQQYSLTDPEDNINLGTYYLDYTHRQYNNNSLLAVASYNAGPGNVAKWLARYGFDDPDTFVEKIPFPETKGYVETVFENYWNYLRIYNPEIAQLLSRFQQEDPQLEVTGASTQMNAANYNFQFSMPHSQFTKKELQS
ncbi:transglycosylase SLT domain-containing protein [Pleurocapsales cyanobacterium LEGE 06147]|nr:transglycosylase SLT domain-containing protein [Pleurocapsales cyanobacterium LEGE 06147]